MGGYKKGKTKQEVKIDLGITHCYKKFIKEYATKIVSKKKHIKVNNKYRLSQQQYSDIIKLVNKRIVEEIVKKNFEFAIPCGLGKLSVRKYKSNEVLGTQRKNSPGVDWNTTHKMWERRPDLKGKQLVRFDNTRTDNHKFCIYYDKHSARYPGCRFYKFEPRREFSQLLHKEIITNTKYDALIRPRYTRIPFDYNIIRKYEEDRKKVCNIL